MPTSRLLVVVAALLLAAPIVRAQAPAEAEPAPEPTPAPAADPAWLALADAFKDVLSHREAAALDQLRELQQRYPGHPAALEARRAEDLMLGQQRHSEISPALSLNLRNESPTSLSRAELVILQTFHGISLGLEFCGLLECDDARAGIGSAMLGAAAGLGGALVYSAEGITPGNTLAVNSGSAWGAWQGIALSQMFDANSRTTVGILLGTQLGGTLVGHLAYRTLGPGAGDVSLANSGGIWAGVLAQLLIASFDANLPTATHVGALLAASDLGLVAGSLLATEVPMSRARTLVIDASGILGMLLGFAVAVLIDANNANEHLLFGLGTVGTVGGLATGYLLTTKWDAGSSEAQP